MPGKRKTAATMTPIADIITEKPKRKRTKAETKLDQRVAKTKAIRESTNDLMRQQQADAAKANSPGRPTTYTEEIAAKFCGLLASGLSVRTICRDNDDMPAASTIFLWLYAHPTFSEQYSRAQEARTEAYVEDIIDIADNTANDYVTVQREDGSEYEIFNHENVARSKLKIEARMWHAGKLKPKKYGQPDPFGGGPAAIIPMIYIPKELPYNAINTTDRKRVDNGTSTDEPAPNQQG